MGFRAIERATGVSHNTVINWVREETSILSDVAEPFDGTRHIKTTKLDELDELDEGDLATSQLAENWLSEGNILVPFLTELAALSDVHHYVIVQYVQAY